MCANKNKRRVKEKLKLYLKKNDKIKRQTIYNM